MEQQIAFSVLIVTYNRAHFIDAAVESVFPQLHPIDEFIIVDDGSTDNTGTVVQKYLGPSNVRYIRKSHTKTPDTRNRALREAKNPFVIWVDSDDILLPHVLENYRQLLRRRSDIDVAYGNLKAFGDTGSNVRKTGNRFYYKDYYKKNSLLLNHLFHRNAVPNPGTLVRKSLYETWGEYNVEFDRAQDYEFWIRIVKHATFKHCGRFVSKWRWHDTNISAPSVKSDPKFTVMALRSLLERYALEEIFASFDWKNREYALAKSYLQVIKRAALVGDVDTVSDFCGKFIKCRPYPDANPELILDLPSLQEGIREKIQAILPRHVWRRARMTADKKKGRSYREKYRLALFMKNWNRLSEVEKRFLELVKKIEGKEKYRDLLLKSFLSLGDIYKEQNRKAGEIYYKKGIKMLETKGAETDKERYRIASLCVKADQLEKAGRLFKELAGDAENKILLAGVYFHLGEIALLEKKYAEAKSNFKECLALNASHQKAREYLKGAHLNDGL